MYKTAKDLGLFKNEKNDIKMKTEDRKKQYQKRLLGFHKNRWKGLSDNAAKEYKEQTLKERNSILDRFVVEKEKKLLKEYVDKKDYNNKPNLKVVKSDTVNIGGHDVIVERVQYGKKNPPKKKPYDEGFIKNAIKEIEVEDKKLLPSRTTSKYQYPAIKVGDMLKVQKQGKIGKTKLLVGQNWQVAEQDKTKTNNIILELYKFTGTGKLKIFRSQDKKISISESDYGNIFKVRIEWDG